jgi:hypothetical protein
MLSSSSLLLSRRFAISQVKRRLFSDVTGSGPSGSGPNIVRRKVSLEERTKLRAARKERATRILQQSQGTASSSASTGGANKSSARLTLLSRYMWQVGLGVPTLLLVWGISDEKSPPAKFAEMIGLTDFIDDVMEQFSKPAHNKLLPDWNTVRIAGILTYVQGCLQNAREANNMLLLVTKFTIRCLMCRPTFPFHTHWCLIWKIPW